MNWLFRWLGYIPISTYEKETQKFIEELERGEDKLEDFEADFERLARDARNDKYQFELAKRVIEEKITRLQREVDYWKAECLSLRK